MRKYNTTEEMEKPYKDFHNEILAVIEDLGLNHNIVDFDLKELSPSKRMNSLYISERLNSIFYQDKCEKLIIMRCSNFDTVSMRDIYSFMRMREDKKNKGVLVIKEDTKIPPHIYEIQSEYNVEIIRIKDLNGLFKKNLFLRACE